MPDRPPGASAAPLPRRAAWAPYAIAVAAVAVTGWLATATLADAGASGIIEEGIDTGGAAAVTAVLVGVPTLLVVLLDGPVLVRRRGTGVTIVHWVLGIGLAAWSAQMVFTVAATACDGSCTTVPEAPVRAAVGVASLVLALGGTLVGLLARHPSRA